MVNLEALIVKAERGPMRKFPPGPVLWANAKLHWIFGEPELHEIQKLVRPGTLAVDVGAHFGTYSIPLAKLVGKQGRVVSVEPIVEDADQLKRAVAQLRLPIDVVNAAISSTNGTATINVPALHGHAKTALSSLEATDRADVDAREVTVWRLDDLLAKYTLPVSFVKIDVEGHELAVLDGALETLKTHKPNILIEINHDSGKAHVQEVFDLIRAQGYYGEFLERGKYRRPLTAFDIDRHQMSAASDVLSDDYVNNFLFLPL